MRVLLCCSCFAFGKKIREESWSQRRLLPFGFSVVLKLSLDLENYRAQYLHLGNGDSLHYECTLWNINVRSSPHSHCWNCELSLCWTAIHSATWWPFLARILLTAHTGFLAFIDIQVQLACECNGLLLVWFLWIENVCHSSRLGTSISQSKPLSSKLTLLQKSDQLLQNRHKSV